VWNGAVRSDLWNERMQALQIKEKCRWGLKHKEDFQNNLNLIEAKNTLEYSENHSKLQTCAESALTCFDTS